VFSFFLAQEIVLSRIIKQVFPPDLLFSLLYIPYFWFVLDFSVIILAAGNSQRMRRSKILLPFDNQLRFIDQLVQQYLLAGVQHIYVVSQVESLPLSVEAHVNWIQNKHPEKGRAWSIYLALTNISSKVPVFIQNIDNPFSDHKLISRMMDSYKPDHIVFPLYDEKKGHPLLLPSSWICKMLQMDFKTFDFREGLANFPCKYLPWKDKKIRANINTVEDYQHWFHQPLYP